MAAIATVSVAVAVWLYLDNRSLRAELADREVAAVEAKHTEAPRLALRAADPWAERSAGASVSTSGTPAPKLPDPPSESRMERRARGTQEFAARFGRLPGESDDDYRARVMPLVSAGLIVPRMRVAEMRKEAEDKAHVTAAQSQQLDHAFDKVYDNVLDLTNKAIADGQLSPYERNVSGWLTYAGGLGGVLDDANGQIGQILSADQVKAMSDSGFEWGEYLGLEAPWEKITPPPPAPPQ